MCIKIQEIAASGQQTKRSCNASAVEQLERGAVAKQRKTQKAAKKQV